MLIASASVRRLDDPIPIRTAPDVQLPALTITRFVPADMTSCSITDCAPLPSATIVITAATATAIPIVLSMVRSRFRRRARTAVPQIDHARIS